MWEAISLVAGNIGMSFENIILLITGIGGLFFFAKDWKLGAIMYFFVNGCLFLWFYNLDLNWIPVLILCLFGLVLLSLTMLPTNKSVQSGGII